MKLSVEEVFKKFDDKVVLNNASFEFESGHIYGLLGRNGAGKTTLFNCMNEDLDYEHGSFSLVDEEGNKKKIETDDIGYVLSAPIVPDFLTGRELLKFYVDINKNNIKEKKTIDEYFDMVEIDQVDRDLLVKDYSHGMKNKMMMLLNFIADPLVWLLDEPLTSLDVVVADEMKKLLKSMRGDHIMIFSTHIMELATGLCDKIVLLKDGCLTAVDRGNMTEDEFEEYIIAALKGEVDAENI